MLVEQMSEGAKEFSSGDHILENAALIDDLVKVTGIYWRLMTNSRRLSKAIIL